MKKMLCITEGDVGGVNRETLPLATFEELGYDITWYSNPLLSDINQTMDCMHETELKGPEGYPLPEELFELVKDVEVIVCHVTPITKKLVDAAPNLKLVACMRGGVDNVDVAYLTEKGITCCNSAWRSSNAVADATIGMLLSVVKNIALSNAGMKNGGWLKEYPNSGNVHDLKNMTCGIIGFGYIGQRVAQRLKGFETNIIVHDPYLPDEKIEALGYKPVSKEELLKNSDAIMIHLRQSAATMKFLDEADFAMMKPNAYLINTARSGLVHESALVKALQEKKIAGAALDVFDIEPLPLDHPFRTMDNVVITAHIAGTSSDTMLNSYTIIYDDLKRYANGEAPLCVVRPFKG